MAGSNKVKILTYNVRGLNSPQKRRLILRELEKLEADIIFLQETHITQDSNVKIFSKNIPIWYYGDSPIKRSKGVAIGFGKKTGFKNKSRSGKTFPFPHRDYSGHKIHVSKYLLPQQKS